MASMSSNGTIANTPVSVLSSQPHPELTWAHVAISGTFILFNAGISTIFRLGLGLSMIVAALRCVGQLAAVATVLEQVFKHENPWTVALIVFVLNLLGTFEIVMNKAPRRFSHMFIIVLLANLLSTIPIAIIGSKYAMADEPFWTPMQFIPIVGMLCGNTISGILIASNYVLKEFKDNRDKIEIYLAFGATRLDACRPIAIQALRLALVNPVNSMSVMGIISIPGMMTGALLGGSSVPQASKLQTIIMFMITASTCLAALFVTMAILLILVDGGCRVRMDRVTERKGWTLMGLLGIPTKSADEWAQIMRQGVKGTFGVVGKGGEGGKKGKNGTRTNEGQELKPFLP